jgi:hypothetical protein
MSWLRNNIFISYRYLEYIATSNIKKLNKRDERGRRRKKKKRSQRHIETSITTTLVS